MQPNSFHKPKSGDTAIPITKVCSRTTPTVKPHQKRALYRLSEIVQPHGMFPISASSWWAGVRSGLYPQSLSLGPRTTVWRAEDLEKLAQYGIDEGTPAAAASSSSGEPQS
jgi:predicted DNA-binding transcriptional regulator AlpA